MAWLLWLAAGMILGGGLTLAIVDFFCEVEWKVFDDQHRPD